MARVVFTDPTPAQQASSMGEPMRIKFTRAPEAAWANVDGRRYEITREKGRKGGGAIYRLVVALAHAGYADRKFTAHDGRITCLRGSIDLKAVPARYGGLLGIQDGATSPRIASQSVPEPSPVPEAAE